MLMLLEFNPSAPAYLPQGAGEGSGGCRTAQVHSDHREVAGTAFLPTMIMGLLGSSTAGTAGAGWGSHIAGVYFESVTDIKLQYVPYRVEP
jgi:hypothetical protein